MSTKIEWCDETWNPVIGCNKISAGCERCYAEKMAVRLARMQDTDYYRLVTCEKPDDKPKGWTGYVTFVRHLLKKPFKWKLKHKTIFVCSMGDLFHGAVLWAFISRVMEVIESTPQHTYVLLTKRPANMVAYFKENRPVPDNVVIGVSAENQKEANRRIPILLSIKAECYCVSVEPMLEYMDISEYMHDSHCVDYDKQDGICICGEPRERHINWVIAGAETGGGARPIEADWVRSLRDQCKASPDTAFFFKSWGNKTSLIDIDGKTYLEYPEFIGERKYREMKTG